MREYDRDNILLLLRRWMDLGVCVYSYNNMMCVTLRACVYVWVYDQLRRVWRIQRVQRVMIRHASWQTVGTTRTNHCLVDQLIFLTLNNFCLILLHSFKLLFLRLNPSKHTHMFANNHPYWFWTSRFTISRFKFGYISFAFDYIPISINLLNL